MFIKTYLQSFQPFTNAFPHADIHELLAPYLLHKLIKGAFKDHIISLVNDHVNVEHPTQEANQILDDIGQWYFLFFICPREENPLILGLVGVGVKTWFLSGFVSPTH